MLITYTNIMPLDPYKVTIVTAENHYLQMNKYEIISWIPEVEGYIDVPNIVN